MSEVVLVSIITGLTTLIAALGGAHLSTRHARRLAADDRRAEREDEARRHVVDALEAGRKWSSAGRGFAMGLAMSGSTQGAQAYLAGATENSSVEDMRLAARTLERALTAAVLLLGPSRLLDELIGLRACVEAFSQEVTQPTFKSLLGEDAALAPGLHYGVEYAVVVDNQIRDLEHAAALHFRGAVARH